MEKRIYELDLYGKKIVAEFSNLVEQANGSVILRCEDTVVLATAVIGKAPSQSLGFFNLTVEYMERNYAVGKILGGQYSKREGRPSDKSVLNSRIIDRTIRPLFDKHIKNPVQVVVTVLSVGDFDPGILGTNAVSLALATSDIPWNGPIGCVAINKLKSEKDGEFKINGFQASTGEPAYDFDLVVCGKENTINMIEAATFQYSESAVSKCFDTAMEAITKLENFQKDIVKKEGKTKINFEKSEIPKQIKDIFEKSIKPQIDSKLFSEKSKSLISEMEDAFVKEVSEIFPSDANMTNIAKDYLDEYLDELFHSNAIDKNIRFDGRNFDELRKLYAQAGGISDIVHGSGIFFRGKTHIATILTLGGPGDATMIDGMEIRGEKRFSHHYNFPPYSVGETGRMGGMNRREMGHGFLAEKALLAVLPEVDAFPYTIRLVSETMSSDGSTSQGSICASTLALMDGGVPIIAPVAGISIGLMTKGEKYKLLTDIQGIEDHFGDMDFKVAGTKNGITAIQLDIKLGGIPVNILKEALIEAKNARMQILEVITKEIPESRNDIHEKAPRIDLIKIEKDQIGMVIGGGGKTINEIRENTGTEIDIKEDGTVYITGPKEGVEKAKQTIEGMTHIYKIGEIVDATIVRIVDFGAFAHIGDYAEGLIHVSEIDSKRVENVNDYLKEGQVVRAKIVKVEDGKIGLSIKALAKVN